MIEYVWDCWTPRMAYAPFGVPETPQGYEVVEFREPKPGDFYLAKQGHLLDCRYGGETKGVPRFILREKEQEAENKMNHRCVVCIRDIYGEETVNAPKGYTQDGFGMPGSKDHWLDVKGEVAIPGDTLPSGPRLILKKLPEFKITVDKKLTARMNTAAQLISLCDALGYCLYLSSQSLKDLNHFAKEHGWEV